MMSREITLFDPDSIQRELDRNLAAGLRMIAEALDCGMLDGRCIDAQGHGFSSANDIRVHILVRIDLAAPVLTIHCGKKTPQLPEVAP